MRKCMMKNKKDRLGTVTISKPLLSLEELEKIVNGYLINSCDDIINTNEECLDSFDNGKRVAFEMILDLLKKGKG